jgi:LPS-assembly lipoprotein
MMNGVVSRFLIVAMCIVLTACGFEMRGSSGLPVSLQTIYIQGVDTRHDFFGLELRRELQRQGATIVEDYETDSAVLTVLENRYRRHVLSVGTDAKVREFELRASASVKVTDAAGKVLVDKMDVEAQRDYQFDRGQILASDEQERVLREDLNKQMVQSIIRRLSVLK